MGVTGKRTKSCAVWGPPMYDNDCTVELVQHGRNKFSVIYGKQVKTNLDYGKAAFEFGSAVMHAAACKGTLDARIRGE